MVEDQAFGTPSHTSILVITLINNKEIKVIRFLYHIIQYLSFLENIVDGSNGDVAVDSYNRYKVIK